MESKLSISSESSTAVARHVSELSSSMDSQKPTLRDQFHTYVPRFITNGRLTRMMSQDAEKGPLVPHPQATWTKACKNKSGETMPQIIAHRGYRSKYPENTMLAFRKAIAAGAQALETDVHLTKDNVVVLSHDPSLTRCFGKDKLVAECDWSSIENLRTIAAPHEPMPRLLDLLNYLNEPGREDIWLLLDIKMDDDSDLMMKRISETVAAVPASSRPWTKRIVLGIWAYKYLTPCSTYLPDYALSNIGFSTIYARQFIKPRTPNVTFNLFWSCLLMPVSGPRFIADAHVTGRAVYAWTVNDREIMKKFIKLHVDGIITDDVEKLVDIQAAWQQGDRKVKIPIQTWLWIIWIWALSTLLSSWIRRRLDRKANQKRHN